MPITSDPDVGWYVTGGECQSYKEEIRTAGDILRGRIAQQTARLGRSADGQDLLAAFEAWHVRFAQHYNGTSCAWGSTTDASIEFARQFNGLELRFVELTGEDLPNLLAPQPYGSRPSPLPFLVAGVAIVGLATLGVYGYIRLRG